MNIDWILVLNWTMVVSGSMGVIGFWAYTLELLQDRVTRTTPWRELNSYQVELAVLTVGGVAIFLSALIAGALLRSCS